MSEDASGDAVVIHPVEKTIQELDDLLVNSSSHPVLQKKDIKKFPKDVIPSKISTVKSDLKSWYNKKYFGGYRQKVSEIEYFNAETQTTTPQEIRNQNVLLTDF
jgi:hypothetical protein